MVVKLVYQIISEEFMANKISIISAIVLLVLGVLGIGVFVALFLFGEGAGAYVSALIVAILLVITAVLDLTVFRGILNAKLDGKKRTEKGGNE